MSRIYTEADLAAAWESGYWHGTSHEGPLNDAAVASKNPHKEKSGLDTPAKKSVQPADETPSNKEIPVNTKTTNYPATVREPNAVEPRPLEGLRSIPTPPAGFTPQYFVNEFAKKPVPEFVGYFAPAIERPGFKVQTTWTPEDGLQMWVDHERDNAFNVAEIQDLVATLAGILQGTTAEAIDTNGK